MKTAWNVLGGLVTTLAISGCGVYSFSASGQAPFESVSVSLFENETIEYELADRLTDAVIDVFIQDNKVEVLEPSRAEAVMHGAIVGYRRDAYTYDQQDNVQEYVVKVSVRVKVVKSDSEDTIWEKDFYAEGIYDAVGETEDDGKSRAIAQITSDILDFTTKSW